jgi:hypothetical protein
MSKREQLILATLGGNTDEKQVKILDAVIKLTLGDTWNMYKKFWDIEGPGVMCFQPENTERSMFYLTLKELHSAQEDCERENNGDLAETFRGILNAAQKLNPEESAGYLINDSSGMRYLELDYQEIKDGT